MADDGRAISAASEGAARLSAGEWEQALAAYERALTAGEDPAAHEGRAWAAWWLDRPDIVFESRRRAYDLHRRRGDGPAAAEVAAWLACDHIDFRGAVAVAGGWIARGNRLAQDEPLGQAHGWLRFFEAYLAYVTGKLDRAVELSSETGRIGRKAGVADLQMLGLALEGAAMVRAARVGEGMQLLDEATATALEGDAEIPISGAWSCCFLVGACTATGDYGRASEWCDRIAEFAERYGSRYMLATCRAEYGAVHMWRGQWREAEELLAASIEDFERSRPAMSGGPIAALAELRRCQGRTREALELLQRAGDGPRSRLCRARLAMDRGQPGRAAGLAERLVRQIPDDARVTRAPALELIVQARAARGELDRAGAALTELRALADLTGTWALRATADFAQGVLRSAHGDQLGAKRLLEDAVDGFTHSGGRFDAARARAELATVLRAQGDHEAAGEEAERAVEDLRELGAAAEAEFAWLLGGERAGRDPGDPLARLTPRQAEVLALIAKGLTNREIAERLVVSEHTVHRHVANILAALEVPSRAAAVARATAGSND